MQMPIDFDCLVVGAGPAGLAAGEILHGAGAEFAIVEARTELGGRARSRVLPEGVVFERGAMFLHGLRVETWEAAARHGLTTHGTYHHEWFTTGYAVADNQWTCEPNTDTYELGLNELGPMLLDPANEGRSLFDVVHQSSSDADLREQMLLEFAELAPIDPREVDAISAGEILMRESPQTALFEFVEGYSELWRRISESFESRVRFDSPVTGIRHSPDGVEVSIGTTTLRATTAIVTVSLGVLQSGAIDFTPALAPEKEEAIAGLRMAPMIKVGARFRSPFWEASIADAMAFTAPGSKHIKSWYLPYAQRGRYPVLLAFIGAGNEALKHTGDTDMLESAVRADLEAAFGPTTIAEELVEILIEDWPSDPYARGAASVVPVGKRHLRAVLAEPTPPLFWAGEACATNGHAECIEGAITTGRTAAIEALHCVRPFKVSQPGSRLDWGKVRE